MHSMYNIKKECHYSVFTHVPHYPSISTTGKASLSHTQEKGVYNFCT
jgi:hypothetical protein